MRVVLYRQFVSSRLYSVLSQICLVLIQSCVVSPIAVLFWLSFLVCLYKGWASRIYNLCKTRLQFHAGMLYFASNLLTPGPKGWLNTLISTIDRMQYQKSVSCRRNVKIIYKKLPVDDIYGFQTPFRTPRWSCFDALFCWASIRWLPVLVQY